MSNRPEPLAMSGLSGPGRKASYELQKVASKSLLVDATCLLHASFLPRDRSSGRNDGESVLAEPPGGSVMDGAPMVVPGHKHRQSFRNANPCHACCITI